MRDPVFIIEGIVIAVLVGYLCYEQWGKAIYERWRLRWSLRDSRDEADIEFFRIIVANGKKDQELRNWPDSENV